MLTFSSFPLLYKGITLAVFKLSGKYPVRNDLFMISEKTDYMIMNICLRPRADDEEIWKDLFLNPTIILLTSIVETFLKNIYRYITHLILLFDTVVTFDTTSWLVVEKDCEIVLPIDEKCWLNTLLISTVLSKTVSCDKMDLMLWLFLLLFGLRISLMTGFRHIILNTIQ